MNPTERTSHPSQAQIVYLLEFLEKNPNLARGFSKVPSARDASRKTWENLTLKLNSLGGCVKTWKQWTKYWADKKSAVKKKGALRYKSRNATGGGIGSVVELSEVEERILILMGGESFSIGDRHLEINPFEESTDVISDNSPSLLVQGRAQGALFLVMSMGWKFLLHIPLTPQPRQIIECIPGTSQPSLRPSVVRMIFPSNPIPQEVAQSSAHTPPKVGPSISVQPPTPSGSGNYPRRRRLNFSSAHARHNTTSSSRAGNQRRRSPPSQRQSHFVTITDRFLSLEEQRIEIDRRNSQVMESFVSNQHERDRLATEALNAIAEGLKMLAEAIRNK